MTIHTPIAPQQRATDHPGFSIDPARAFQVLADVAPAGIWQTNAAGDATYVNEHFLELTGMRNDEWRGPQWADAIHPDDRDRVFGAWIAAVEARRNFRETWRWKRPDDSIIWVDTIGAPDIDEGGTVLGFVGINIDITATKAVEAKLRKARQRAEDATKAKSAFLANMSHEIRTPMNGVLGFADLMLAGELSESQRGYAQMIADSGQAMMQLLNDILDMAKIEAGQMELRSAPVELAHKLRTSLRLIEAVAQKKGLALELDVDPALPGTVTTDPLRLRQIVFNLLGNAAKFTEAGTIKLSARSIGGGARMALAVSDTGRGIAPDKQAAIFQQFAQEDGTIARKYGGTGLGLAITSQLVELMGGTIALDSVPGEGSTFTVELPLALSTDRVAGDTAPAMPASPTAPAPSGPRVLVAEDHDINQMLILAMLEQSGIAADLAQNGEEAVAMVAAAWAEGRPYALALMDVQMPVMDGLEATRRIRAAGVAAGRNAAEIMPIVALTANCYEDDIAACRAAGMQHHLAKPVTLEALAEAVATYALER
ncbi:MAG: ATP-binding protein [Parerythrobacter sp.]